MKRLKIVTFLFFLTYTLNGLAQADFDQNGIRTTVSTITNGTANPLRFGLATVRFNSHHWQNSRMVVIELFQQYYTPGYERYIVKIGHGQGAASCKKLRLLEVKG